MFTITTRDQNYFLHLSENYLTFTTAALHLGTFHICFPEIENSQQNRNKEQKKEESWIVDLERGLKQFVRG